MQPEQLAKDGSEHGHQSAFFCWVAIAHPWLRNLIFAIPNGGARGDDPRSNKIRGGMLKAEGVKDSIPDIFCSVPRNVYHGLYLELKRPASPNKRAGVATDEQLACHMELRKQGYYVEVCIGWENAASCLTWYLNL